MFLALNVTLTFLKAKAYEKPAVYCLVVIGSVNSDQPELRTLGIVTTLPPSDKSTSLHRKFRALPQYVPGKDENSTIKIY